MILTLPLASVLNSGSVFHSSGSQSSHLQNEVTCLSVFRETVYISS